MAWAFRALFALAYLLWHAGCSSGQPPLPPRLVTAVSSTDTQVTIAWPLERSRERGARTRGWYVYVSQDGTNWPAPDSPTRHINDDRTTQYTYACGPMSQLMIVWFRVAAASEAGRGPMSTPSFRRCSALPSAPTNFVLAGTTFDERRHKGVTELQWDAPADLHGAVLLGYRIYGDDGHQLDAEDRYHVAAVVRDLQRRVYRRSGTVLGQVYKFKVAAVTEIGEGAAAQLDVKATALPMAPPVPTVERFPVHKRHDPAGKYGGDDPFVDIIIVWDALESIHGAATLAQALGGADEVTAWAVYLSNDGITWDPSAPLATVVPVASTLPPFDLTLERRLVYPCNIGEFLYFRVAAVTSVGTGEMSDTLRVQCARPPTDAPPPKRVGGGDDYITLELSRADLHGAVLLGYTLTYQKALNVEATAWEPERTLFVSANEHLALHPKTWVNITGITPGLPVRFKAKTMSEAGLSELGEWRGLTNTGLQGYQTVDKWQVLAYAGPEALVPGPPVMLNFTNASGRADLAFEWSPPDTTGGAPLLGYDIFVTTGNEDRWPALPTASVGPEVTSYVHDCAQTSDQRIGSVSASYERYIGWPDIIQDRFCTNEITNNIGFFPGESEANCSSLCTLHPFCNMYVMSCGVDCYLLSQCDTSPQSLCGSYIMMKTEVFRPMLDVSRISVRVMPRTAAGRGEATEAVFFCAPPPEPPVVELASFAPEQITIRWTAPETYGADIVKYKIFADDGLGGRFELFAELTPAQALASQAGAEADASLLHELAPLTIKRVYRVQVSVVTTEAESVRSEVVQAPTCRPPDAAPRVQYLPTTTQMWVYWTLPKFDPAACRVKEYQVVLERLVPVEYEPPPPCDFSANDSNCTNFTTNATNFTVPPPAPTPTPGPYWEYANESEIVEVTETGVRIAFLYPGHLYRFLVRTDFAAGFYDGDWVIAPMVGLPGQVGEPARVDEESSAEHITLRWTEPPSNLGKIIGYEVFRSGANGDVDLSEPDITCIGAVDLQCTSACSYAHSSEAGQMLGCAISGLEPDSVYQFRVRAINEHGNGPMGPVVQHATGATPLAHPPSLVDSDVEGCMMTLQWKAAQERGTPVSHYELWIETCDAYNSTSMSFRVPRAPSVVRHIINASFWSELVPGKAIRARVIAESSIGASTSEWSSCGRCLSAPPVPVAPRRDPTKPVVAGVIALAWDAVAFANETGGEDPKEGGCFYELFGRPAYPSRPDWRSILRARTHDPAAGGKPAHAGFNVVTAPETPLGFVWEFKLRLENSGGFYSDSDLIGLGSGNLPDVPRNLVVEFDIEGKLRLTWQPTPLKSAVPLLRYEYLCGDMADWGAVSPHLNTYALDRVFPPGRVECQLRAATSAGPSPSLHGAALSLR